MDGPLPSERVPALNKTARTQFGPETALDPHSLGPGAHLGPENTSTQRVLWLGTYFGPEILWPKITLTRK